MPQSIIEIPYFIFKFLIRIKSPALMNPTVRQEINKNSQHFKDDNFLAELIQFYSSMFGDESIANPEIRESLIYKMDYLLKKKETALIFSNQKELIENLIKGLLNYMSIESLSHVSCDIIVKIIKPICFGQTDQNVEKSTRLVNVTKQFFEGNVDTFHEFMDNYIKLINKVMTEYTMSLSEAKQVKYI